MNRRRVPSLCAWMFLGAIAIVAPATPAAGATVEDDLSVGWISRLPTIDYVWGSTDPAREGWPAVGDPVTWVANVRSLGRKKLTGVAYHWSLDGEVVATGVVTLSRRGVTEIELPWTWDFRRHELVFEIDPSAAVPEIEERNNRLLIHTDALGVGFWVEKRLWRRLKSTVTAAGIGGTTFDDWMQRRIRQFNEMAELARYPGAPKGALDRWRVDAIHIVRKGKLPLSPLGPEVRDWGAEPSSYPTLYPDTEDRSIDMQWGFPARAVWYQDYGAYELLYDSLVHELGHARYLIDVYAWNLSQDNDVIEIDPPPPADRFGRIYTTPEAGMMHFSWAFMDRYSAMALNRIAGHRAVAGHYNEPSNIGIFLNDLPKTSRIKLVTPDGTTFPNRTVRLYRASSDRDPDFMSHPYQLRFDGVPDLETETDGQGRIRIDGNPFADGTVHIEVDRNNALVIVELVDGTASRWGYLEARVLNLAYWNGETDLAEIELEIDGPICNGSGLGPSQVTPAFESIVESREVTFGWPDIGADIGLWTAVDGGRPKAHPIDLGGNSATVTFSSGERVAWWLSYRSDAAAPGCPEIRTSTYFFDLP